MKKTLPDCINIFLSVDADSVFKYNNSHDPAPLYNRQLSHEFQEYLKYSVPSIERTSSIRYKLICKKESDQRFTESILMSIRRHFETKRIIKEQGFKKYRRKKYTLFFTIFLSIILFQAVLPAVLNGDHLLHPFFSTAIYVFGYLLFLQSIERLISLFNPFKKDILLLKKMESAESIVIVNEKEFALHIKYDDAA